MARNIFSIPEISRRKRNWTLQWAALAACAAISTALTPLGAPREAWALPVEAPLTPTVHPTLTPSSAIDTPLQVRADNTSVWRSDMDQHMLCTGNVKITLGYREMQADNAAFWLTPSRDSGENTYEVAIYLAGHVRVAEGTQITSTVDTANELLVTTRISQTVQLTGTPVSRAEQNSPLVLRGNQLREGLLNRPVAVAYIPDIVVTPAEQALQNGWIAKGPNNRFVPGPGDVRLVEGGPNPKIEVGTGTAATKPAKAAPELFATFEGTIRSQTVGGEQISIVPSPYMLWNKRDGKPPIEFRAQRMVVFSPEPKTGTGKGATPPTATGFAALVTGVYLEGDVTLNSGNQVVHASRIYYDFTSDRAIMLDATLSTVDEIRHVPLYLRAQEIRQLARGQYAAKKATFSTSEFYTPHYNIGASDIYLQDITSEVAASSGTGGGGGGGGSGTGTGTGAAGAGGGGSSEGGFAGGMLGLGETGQGGSSAPKTYAFAAKDATVDVHGMPIFYWPYLSGDTSKSDIPLRRVRASNSRTYGPSIETDWNLLGLMGQQDLPGLRADLMLDYFGKRGPAGGIDSTWNKDDSHGMLRSYALLDQGTDRLGRDITDLTPENESRGRLNIRHQQDLGDGWTLQLEGSYISDPTFLQQFFQDEYDTDKEHETSVYLKHQGDTDAISLLGKFHLYDFTATADQVDQQYSTDKKPELKYWRLGDSFLDMFTYYSESGIANVQSSITNYTPTQIGLASSFLGFPAANVPPNMTFRQYYESLGWVSGSVMRGDTRQELDMPLVFGDLKVTPYVTGRVTAWDDAFPESDSGNTTRLWGAAGLRSSMQFWRVYNDAQSTFWDVHTLRHIIEPRFQLFVAGSNINRDDLQPFDPSVEDISDASGTQLALNQRWQTKRGGPGHWRDVDWLTVNVQWNQFWNQDDTPTVFYPGDPLIGYFDPSRPDLSLVRNSISADGTWRVGEHFRFLAEENYDLDNNSFEQIAAGVAVDQTNNLSYFFGNRYIRALGTDEWTVAADYQLTRKYELVAAQSYDVDIGANILSSLTLIRRMPRFNAAVTVAYDADVNDTSVVLTMWPEGFPELGIGSRTVGAAAGR